MPEVDEVTLEVGDDEENEMPGPALAESGNMTVSMTAMANEFGAAAGRRVHRFDQLGADSSSVWASALVSPTVMTAHGMRIASEAGSGRTRAEVNRPSETSAASPE